MDIPEELRDTLVSDRDTLSGAVRFKGTRVPVQALLDALTCGRTLEYFMESYPGVTREQIQAVVRWQQDREPEAFGLNLAS